MSTRAIVAVDRRHELKMGKPMTKPTTGEQAKIQLSVNLAATLVYLAYRILGATKEHAWLRARVDVANAIMDKTVEKIGLVDARHKGKPGIQAFFEGGSIDGTTRFVEDCVGINVTQKVEDPADARCHVYRRTHRMRGQQVIFTYRGLVATGGR